MAQRTTSFSVELGHEPPLILGGKTGEPPAKGRISARWLAGTVLTGLAGAALMAATATNTLDRTPVTIEKPQMIKPRDQASHLAGDLLVTGRKGDRLIQRADIIAARQAYKAPVVRRGAGGEVIRLASFTRIASPLALDTIGFADQVPSYNVARLVADASEDRALEGPQQGAVDSDVTLATRNIDEGPSYPAAAFELREEEALAQALEALAISRRTAPSLPAQMLLAKAMRGPNDYGSMNFSGPGREPFSRLVVRMVPENVSVFPRLEAALARNTPEQRVITIRSEENAEQVLRGLGLTQAGARDAVRTLARAGQTTADGKRLKITLQPLEPGAARAVVRIELYAEETRLASVGRRDDGVFVPFETERRVPQRRPTASTDDEDEGGFTLFQSLHETARKHNVPKAMIDDMIRVLFFDVDLQRAVQAGDSMELLMSNDDADQPNELLLLAVTIGGDTRRFYRFPLPEDEVVDYFDDQGRSAKKFLIRKPIAEGEMRSTFGSRRHPILGYYRMHNGVDWAARMGTPILAAGNGTVRFADWSSGYGRRVEIQHTNGYVTTYNHMSGFGPKISEGARVRQGQVVGYLGSTGLSTGPHLHYEVMINERHVDPLAIKLPRGRELDGIQLADFKKMREQTDQVLKRAPGSTASLPAAIATTAKPGG